MSETVIKLENIGKQYRLGTVGSQTLRGDLQRWWYRVRGKEDPALKIGSTNALNTVEGEYVWALRDINLEVKQGEVLGIIGKNGAGKSTLLKLLSRVTGPSIGQIKVKGRIASLLEVGTGFHPELTGRENIFLNGAILGMRKWEIKKKLDEIVDFAGVAKYLDTPVKRYSSGMYVRLAFAVAAHLEPDILVVDEVLAVGDAEFQKKAIGKMQDVSSQGGRTVLFVSYNMTSIRNLCKKGILLKSGMISFEGAVESCIQTYNTITENQKEEAIENNKIKIISFNIKNKYKENVFTPFEEIFFNLKFETKQNLGEIDFTLHFYNEQNIRVLVISSVHKKHSIKGTKGKHEITFKLDNFKLIPGRYFISVGIFEDRIVPEMMFLNHFALFDIEQDDRFAIIAANYEGIYYPKFEILNFK
ncbi:MAG: ABC transporter ATP-binding protein [Bacteroidales bacterium]|nr:ABC transporter ATP-binding protein [Bacteroidales bacterium]